MNRSDTLAALRDHPDVSVLIVGGGINGIGTFRDLALNGVDVLLVDRADFCSGASAASSHMAHGGIRYLENGDFRLVREAVQERNRLIRNAPHLVHPLPTTIPIFRRFSGLLNAPLKFLGLLDRPSERGALVIKLGLMLYDAYTGRQRVVPKHQFLGRRESLARWRELNPAVTHTATYFDGAIMQPERLALELLLDAEASNPDAHALNYVGLVGHADGHVTLRDAISGSDYTVRPRLVVNAAGPWIDLANQSLGVQTRFIGGTKGSHLVLDHPQLRAAIGDHEFFFENKDGRIVLIFPLFDRVLVGTSDIPTGSPDDAVCTEDEVDYFLEMIGRVFPAIRVGREHIVFRFSGVRPLAASKSKTAGQITRDHEIQIRPRRSEPACRFRSIRSWAASGRPSGPFPSRSPRRRWHFSACNARPTPRSLPIGGGRDFPLGIEDRATAVSGIVAAAGRSDRPRRTSPLSLWNASDCRRGVHSSRNRCPPALIARL